VTIVTTVTTAATLFAPISPALNGFRWVNSFLFGRPTFPPAAVHPITVVALTPFWENFLRDLTHPAGCSSFYTVLLFLQVVAGFDYRGPVFPADSFRCWYSMTSLLLFLYGYQSGHPSFSGVIAPARWDGGCPTG